MSVVAMTSGKILDNKVFETLSIARNYAKWKFKQRTWKDISETVIACKFTGRKIEFIELSEYNGEVL